MPKTKKTTKIIITVIIAAVALLAALLVAFYFTNIYDPVEQAVLSELNGRVVDIHVKVEPGHGIVVGKTVEYPDDVTPEEVEEAFLKHYSE